MKKKQHFIQKRYIEFFANKNHVFVYDKDIAYIYSANINDVFEENNFYRLPIKKYYDSMDENNKRIINKELVNRYGKKFECLDEKTKNEAEELIEDFFANEVEPAFLRVIETIKWELGKQFIGYKNRVLSEESKYLLSVTLSYYYCRTRFFRDNMLANHRTIYKKVLSLMAETQGISINENDINVDFTDDQIKMEHIQIISQIMDDDGLIKTIFNTKWTFFINATKIPFIISDTFITIKLTERSPFGIGTGIGAEGAESYFAISPQIMMVMNDSVAFPNIKNGLCYICKDEDEIININMFILNNCHKKCASSDGQLLSKLSGKPIKNK